MHTWVSDRLRCREHRQFIRYSSCDLTSSLVLLFLYRNMTTCVAHVCVALRCIVLRCVYTAAAVQFIISSSPDKRWCECSIISCIPDRSPSDDQYVSTLSVTVIFSTAHSFFSCDYIFIWKRKHFIIQSFFNVTYHSFPVFLFYICVQNTHTGK